MTEKVSPLWNLLIDLHFCIASVPVAHCFARHSTSPSAKNEQAVHAWLVRNLCHPCIDKAPFLSCLL